MFTDIVGYTALMGKDESLALQILKKNREIHKPLIKKCQGRWLKEMGDPGTGKKNGSGRGYENGQ